MNTSFEPYPSDFVAKETSNANKKDFLKVLTMLIEIQGGLNMLEDIVVSSSVSDVSSSS